MPDGCLCRRCRRPTRRRTNWLQLPDATRGDPFHHLCPLCFVARVAERPESEVRRVRANGRWTWVCDGCESEVRRGDPVIVVTYNPPAVATRSLVRRQRRLADVKRTWELCPPCADAAGLSSPPPKAPGGNGAGCSPTHTGPAG